MRILSRARLVAMILSLAATIVAVGLFWQFNRAGSIWKRAPIPPSQIEHANGYRYNWHVPPELRAAPWYRAEVRVWEDRKALPSRVEDPEYVAGKGKGTFGVAPFSVGSEQKELLWFSATDNTDPSTNGRKYEFEVRRPGYRKAIVSAICIVVAIVSALFALLSRLSLTPACVMAETDEGIGNFPRNVAVFCALLAIIVSSQSWSWARFIVRAELPSGALIYEDGKGYSWRLPRWVSEMNLDSAYLLEDGTAMTRISESGSRRKNVNGTYYFSFDEPNRVCFRPSDSSDAGSGMHKYSLAVPIFPILFAPRFAGLLFLMSGLLLMHSNNFGIFRPLLRWRSKMFLSIPRWFHQSGWRIAILTAAIIKLWATGGAEIAAENYDAHVYATSAMMPGAALWGNEWDGMSSHPSGFPFVAGILGQFGIPWRFAVELLYLGSCASLAMAASSLIRSRLAIVMLFTAMAWHPWTFTGFCAFMTEPIVLICAVLLLANMFAAFAQVSSQWRFRTFLGMGALLFLWEWSRREDVLVYSTYILFALLIWIKTSREANHATRRRRMTLLASPLLIVFLLSTGVRIANYFHYGIYAKSRISAPALAKLMTALYHIKPDKQLPYVAVTRQSLEAACRESPSLLPFEENLMNPRPEHRGRDSVNGAPGEFGAMLDFLLLASLPSDARTANDVMLASASEINKALSDGRLPWRPALFPLDPDWRLWLPDVPRCFVTELRRGIAFQPWKIEWKSDDSELQRDFDEAADRKSVGIDSRVVLVNGSVRLPTGILDSVALTDSNGVLLASCRLASNRIAEGFDFNIQWRSQEDSQRYGLAFYENGQRQFFDPGHDAKWWATNWNFITNTGILSGHGEKAFYSYKVSMRDSMKKDRLNAWETVAEPLCKGLVIAAVFIAFIAEITGPVWTGDRLLSVTGCLILTIGWLSGRAILYAFLNANMGWYMGLDTDRFMSCMSPIFPAIATITGALLAAVLRQRLAKQKQNNPH